MRKDNFGICLSFYAVLGFVFALLGQTVAALLLLGFVIVVEKDQWLTMQVMQAFFLSIFSGIVTTIIGIFSVLYKIPLLGVVFSGIFGVISAIISLIVIVFAIIGISKTAKGEDANIPLAGGFAKKAFGVVKNVTYTQE
ncbi:MAG: hypothetical protein NC337_15055 [Roseburia sp.]|nr:hypothetical protein [Roseburia sp.]